MYGRYRGNVKIPQGLPGPFRSSARRSRPFFELVTQPELHLAGGLFGKSYGRDPAEGKQRNSPFVFQHEMENTIDQGAGLARPGRGFDGKGKMGIAHCPLAVALEGDHSSSIDFPSRMPI